MGSFGDSDRAPSGPLAGSSEFGSLGSFRQAFAIPFTLTSQLRTGTDKRNLTV